MICRVAGCHEHAVEGALFCRANGHLGDSWLGRLERRPDGSYEPTTGPRGR